MDDRRQWGLPSLKCVQQLLFRGLQYELYDVKYYPYTKPGEDSILAVVGQNFILILRLTRDTQLEVIQAIEDTDEQSNNYYACAWSQEVRTGKPILCVAGANSKINIIDAVTGKLLRTLVGHGANVNDLVVSPTNPQILASASDDSTIRVWSLDAEHEKHACAVICAGEGHRGYSLQTIAFHPNGRYLLSGGIDHIVNLWGIPQLPDSNTGTDQATLIHYPLFSTSQIHSNIVDCVAFHGDLILSKALGEECIVLWKITGFSSSDPIPNPSEAPSTYCEFTKHADTRSVFHTLSSDRIRETSITQYSRLLQFKVPNCDTFYMRFRLSPPFSPTAHLILMMANNGHPSRSHPTKVFFWDLSRLEAYQTYISAIAVSNPPASISSTDSDPTDLLAGPQRPHWLLPARKVTKDRLRAIHSNSETPSISSSLNTTESETDLQSSSITAMDFKACKPFWDCKYSIGDPLFKLVAHKEVPLSKMLFTARQCAWSPDGETCVVVGSEGVIGVLGRREVGKKVVNQFG